MVNEDKQNTRLAAGKMYIMAAFLVGFFFCYVMM